MLWFIDQQAPKDQALSPEFQADRDRLAANGHLAKGVATVDISRTAADLTLPAVGRGADDLDVHVSAHAGLDGPSGPWIGGVSIADFVTALKKKFSVAGLEGATIWLLVCDIGKVLDQVAAVLAADPAVENVTLYAPKSLMFISTAGIPHCYAGKLDSVQMNKLVAKYDADYSMLGTQDFMGTGSGWAGGALVNGQWKPYGTGDVEEAVREKFGLEEME